MYNFIDITPTLKTVMAQKEINFLKMCTFIETILLLWNIMAQNNTNVKFLLLDTSI